MQITVVIIVGIMIGIGIVLGIGGMTRGDVACPFHQISQPLSSIVTGFVMLCAHWFGFGPAK